MMRAFVVFAALVAGLFSLGCAGSSNDGGGWQGGSGPAADGGAPMPSPGDSGSPDTPPVVSHAPGTLVITSPARAAFIAASSNAVIAVTGTGASAALTIDGQSATVKADGSFSGTVTPSVGLNLIHAVDGTSSLDVPFLYGTFASPVTGVPQAVALRINPTGIDNGDPNAVTLAGLANRGLSSQDLLASIQGQTYSGGLPANGSWSFTVTNAKYAGTTVQLAAQSGGLSLIGTVRNVEVDGNLTINIFGTSPSGPVSLTADSVVVTATANVSLDAQSQVSVGVVSPQTTLNNFQYHSNNAGFPCCVDGIMTGVLKPNVSQAVQTGVQQNLPPALTLALSSFGLPSTFDLTALGVPAMLGLVDAFDGVTFDIGGGTLSATATVSAALANGPGSGAPGWLRLGRPMGSLPAASPFGLAVSVDLANQVLFNVWGQGALAQTIPDPTVGMLQTAPALPPVLLPDGHGGVTFAMGEVVVQATVGGQTLSAGVSIVTDVNLSVGMSPSALVLTPTGTPQVSLTWLQASGLPDSLKQSLAASAASEVAGLIQPLVIPLPSIPLDALSPSLAGKVAVFAPGATVAFDTPSGRADLSGAMAITP